MAAMGLNISNAPFSCHFYLACCRYYINTTVESMLSPLHRYRTTTPPAAPDACRCC
jgi:hypothetical protein